VSEQDSSHVKNVEFDPVPGQDQLADQVFSSEKQKAALLGGQLWIARCY